MNEAYSSTPSVFPIICVLCSHLRVSYYTHQLQQKGRLSSAAAQDHCAAGPTQQGSYEIIEAKRLHSKYSKDWDENRLPTPHLATIYYRICIFSEKYPVHRTCIFSEKHPILWSFGDIVGSFNISGSSPPHKKTGFYTSSSSTSIKTTLPSVGFTSGSSFSVKGTSPFNAICSSSTPYATADVVYTSGSSTSVESILPCAGFTSGSSFSVELTSPSDAIFSSTPYATANVIYISGSSFNVECTLPSDTICSSSTLYATADAIYTSGSSFSVKRTLPSDAIYTFGSSFSVERELLIQYLWLHKTKHAEVALIHSQLKKNVATSIVNLFQEDPQEIVENPKAKPPQYIVGTTSLIGQGITLTAARRLVQMEKNKSYTYQPYCVGSTVEENLFDQVLTNVEIDDEKFRLNMGDDDESPSDKGGRQCKRQGTVCKCRGQETEWERGQRDAALYDLMRRAS
ncbi:hypothetical protein MMC22_007412 [Lobaria immixta]|nr:hypothetical protein [Lobaria immixta]